MVEGAETCDAPVLSLSFAGAVNAAKIWLPRFQLQKSAPDSLRKELAIDLGRWADVSLTDQDVPEGFQES